MFAISTVTRCGSPRREVGRGLVKAWCRVEVTTVDDACASVQRAKRHSWSGACGSLLRTDGRHTRPKYNEFVVYFPWDALATTPPSPLDQFISLSFVSSRASKSPSICQRHVRRPCAQPSAIDCCCDTYRVHSACHRVPRIFYQSCERRTSLFSSSDFLLHYSSLCSGACSPLTILPANTRDYSPLSPWRRNRRGSRAVCPLVNRIT